ncbi:hypothetical protein, variant 1 [Aphanomyces astaci]|uniref:Uncharacterized protein n=1 Tax=Aphanomyces astaci TaxID=112090 RepID=W4GSD2_APHAT|nr:hypothetical protein, variant 1 [Aphanomyces astaci]ETV82592.1 hypothetical protein, variant 1 [Aphanomyces astaci]|eukprot:XP_009828261.1 hypothetical protein, variant 1 [Aphanomyces astaci]
MQCNNSVLRLVLVWAAAVHATQSQGYVDGDALLLPVFFGESPLVVPVPVGTTTIDAHLNKYCLQHSLSRATGDALINAISGSWDTLYQFSYLRIDEGTSSWSVVPTTPVEIASSVCSYLTRTIITVPSTQRDSCMMTLKLEFSRTMTYLNHRRHMWVVPTNDQRTIVQVPSIIAQQPNTSFHKSMCPATTRIYGNLGSPQPPPRWPVCNDPALERPTNVVSTTAAPALKPSHRDISLDVVVPTRSDFNLLDHSIPSAIQLLSNTSQPRDYSAIPAPTLRHPSAKGSITRRSPHPTGSPVSLPVNHETLPWPSYVLWALQAWLVPFVMMGGTLVVCMRAGGETHTAQIANLQRDNQVLRAALHDLSSTLRDSIARAEAIHATQLATAQAVEHAVATLTDAVANMQSEKSQETYNLHAPVTPQMSQDEAASHLLRRTSSSVLLRRLSGSMAISKDTDTPIKSPFRMAAASIIALGLHRRSSAVGATDDTDLVVVA